MNVEIGAEAVQLPEKEYIHGIAVAVQRKNTCNSPHVAKMHYIKKGTHR